MESLQIKPFKYNVSSFDGGKLLGSHASTSQTRYEAKKNMYNYLKHRGYRMLNVKITVKLIKK